MSLWKLSCLNFIAQPFSLIVSYGLHTSFIFLLVQKNKNIYSYPSESLRFGLCHTFTPRPWKHGFAFTPRAWRYDTNQTLSIKIQLKRMIYLQQELGRAWVCLPLALVRGIYHSCFLLCFITWYSTHLDTNFTSVKNFCSDRRFISTHLHPLWEII